MYNSHIRHTQRQVESPRSDSRCPLPFSSLLSRILILPDLIDHSPPCLVPKLLPRLQLSSAYSPWEGQGTAAKEALALTLSPSSSALINITRGNRRKHMLNH